MQSKRIFIVQPQVGSDPQAGRAPQLALQSLCLVLCPVSSLSFWLFRLLAALSEGLRLSASEEVRPSSVLIGPPLTCPSPPPLLIEIPYCRLDSWRFSWGVDCKKNVVHRHLGGARRSGLTVFLRSLTASMKVGDTCQFGSVWFATLMTFL